MGPVWALMAWFPLVVSPAGETRAAAPSAAAYPLITLDKYVDTIGAKCLDGSPAAFFIRQGAYTLNDSYIVDFCGGGWCYDEGSCLGRSGNHLLGSSNFLPKDGGAMGLANGGLLSDSPQINPDFWNWTKVFVIYCDGVSFTGDRAEPLVDPASGKKAWLRGKANLEAVFAELNASHGLTQAKRVIVSGNSAGGLTVYTHLDRIRSMITSAANLLGFPDGGFFLDIADVHGKHSYRANMANVFNLSSGTAGVEPACRAANVGQEWRCIFAEYVFPFLKTPLFAVESLYDAWQIPNVEGAPICSASYACATNATTLAVFQGFRTQMLAALQPVIASAKGIWTDSCVAHCQTTVDGAGTWNGAWKVGGRNPSQAFGDCYFGRGPCQSVEKCAWPCNPTCPGD